MKTPIIFSFVRDYKVMVLFYLSIQLYLTAAVVVWKVKSGTGFDTLLFASYL